MNKRRRNRAKDRTAATQVIAWRIADWCKALSISRAQYYLLLARGGIEVTYLGTMPLITTSPENYLARAAEQPKASEPHPVKRAHRRRQVAHSEPASTAAPLAALPPER
jgi:hypothetical protein